MLVRLLPATPSFPPCLYGARQGSKCSVAVSMHHGNLKKKSACIIDPDVFTECTRLLEGQIVEIVMFALGETYRRPAQ